MLASQIKKLANRKSFPMEKVKNNGCYSQTKYVHIKSNIHNYITDSEISGLF